MRLWLGLRLLGRGCHAVLVSSFDCLFLSEVTLCLVPFACFCRRSHTCIALTMADAKLANAPPSDDEKFAADEKQISTPSSIHDHRTPEAVAAEYGLSEKKLLRKLDLYLVPGVAVSLIANG